MQPIQAEPIKRCTGWGTCKPYKTPKVKEPNKANQTEETLVVAKTDSNLKANCTEETSEVAKTDNKTPCTNEASEGHMQ